MKINVLPQTIANMIAAGEVVERPASVVKELAENSVDAGAKHITIEIKRGGMSYIRVTDDGCGIDSGEVVTAFLRHATSKIKTEADLNSIYTLGFRGEALASIAAVVRYRTTWQQIAERFENYNERLIFESMNEVVFDKLSEDRAFSLYNRLSQEFVNVIRQSGGNNPQRHIVIAGYGADVEQTLDSRFVMPDDPAGRSIVSVHYRTPRAFCVTGGTQKWGSPEEQIEMDGLLSRLFERFSADGVPVIISEYGVADGADEDSMMFFCESLAHSCKELGMAAFLWDGGELFDRENLEWRSSALISALVQATDGSEYIPVKFGETTQETSPEESQG